MDLILSQIFGATPFIPFKIGALILFALYIAYAFIVYRQTLTMTKVVEADVSSTITLLSLIHFLSSIFLFIWTIIFL